jgi:hypothetical protein
MCLVKAGRQMRMEKVKGAFLRSLKLELKVKVDVDVAKVETTKPLHDVEWMKIVLWVVLELDPWCFWKMLF